jgi:hypothetical protein
MAIWVEAKIEELILVSQRGSGLINSIVVEEILVRWLDQRNGCHQQSDSYNVDNALWLHTANENEVSHGRVLWQTRVIATGSYLFGVRQP